MLGRIFSVVSGKGGAGKSTVATNIARLLAQRGNKVLLVDTDGGICSAELLTEHGAMAIYNSADVLAGIVSIDEAIVTYSDAPDFLAAPKRPLLENELRRLAALLVDLLARYDDIIIDRPAGLDFSLEQHCSDVVGLVVSSPDELALRGARLACDGLRESGCTKSFLIINRFLPELIRKRIMPDVDTLCDRVGAQLLGILPEDQTVVYDHAKGQVTPTAPYYKALTRIVGRLSGEHIPLPKLKKLLK